MARAQLEDFWEDILHLSNERVHYTGVITLEPVPRSQWSKWENDEWIIEGVGFKPFYVVDGQTTTNYIHDSYAGYS